MLKVHELKYNFVQFWSLGRIYPAVAPGRGHNASSTSLTAAASDGFYSSATEEASSRDAYICHFAHSPRRVFQILGTAKLEQFSLSQYSMNRHFVLLKSQPLSWAGIFTSLPWSSLSRYAEKKIRKNFNLIS